MKKILVSLAVICMVSLFAVTAFAANALVSGFDAADIAAYMNYNTGLSMYSVEAPTVEAAKGDNGNGVKITAGSKNAWVQGFNVQDDATLAALMENWAAGKYLKLYVENTSDKATFGLRFTFNGEGTAASFDCSKAVLYAKNGSKPEVKTNDGGGFDSTDGGGKAVSAIVIPAGFKGYVYFPLDNCTVAAPAGWGKALHTNFNEGLKTMEIDVRENFGEATSLTYILDSLEIVDEIQPTADFSVIAYAVAAITGCGALVVAKKRK